MSNLAAFGSFLNAGTAHRRGERQIAANKMREAMSLVDWSTRETVLVIGQWSFYLDEAVDEWCVYVDSQEHRVICSTRTYDTISMVRECYQAFIFDMTKGSSGMRYLPVDGHYAEALRAYMAENDPEVGQKDALTELEESIERLLLEAASVNQTGDEAAHQLFAVRFTQAQERFRDLKGRLAVVESQLDLAKSAL